MKNGYAKGGHLESLDDTQNFKSAFSEARKSGAGTFSWRGKKYGTELAKSEETQPTTSRANLFKNQNAVFLPEDTAGRRAALMSSPEKPIEKMANRPRTNRSATDTATLDSLITKSVPARETPVITSSTFSEGPIATFKRGGYTSSASKRADGIAQRGKTRA